MMKNSPMMMMDIGKIKKELMDSVERSHGEMTLSMLVMEDELKSYKTECEELREEVLRLKEDNRVMVDREERSQEKYRKLVEDVKIQEEVSKTKVVELQHKIKVLEHAKRWADERYRKLEENVKIQEEISKMKVVELQLKIKDLERAKTSADARVEQCKTMFEALGSNALRMEEDIRVLMSKLSLVSTPVVEEEDELLGAAANTRPDNADLKGPHSSQIACVTKAMKQAVHSDSEMTVEVPVKKKETSVAVIPNSRSKVSTMRSNGEHVFVVEIFDSDDERKEDNLPPLVLKRKRASLSESSNGDLWENELDLLLALEKCPELCMRAICALYRVNFFKEISDKGLELPNCQNIDKSEAPSCSRGILLAEFLIDGNPQATLKKSILELRKYDPKGVEDCKRLATMCSHKLFEIYTKFKDPYFHPFF